ERAERVDALRHRDGEHLLAVVGRLGLLRRRVERGHEPGGQRQGRRTGRRDEPERAAREGTAPGPGVGVRAPLAGGPAVPVVHVHKRADLASSLARKGRVDQVGDECVYQRCQPPSTARAPHVACGNNELTSFSRPLVETTGALQVRAWRPDSAPWLRPLAHDGPRRPPATRAEKRTGPSKGADRGERCRSARRCCRRAVSCWRSPTAGAGGSAPAAAAAGRGAGAAPAAGPAGTTGPPAAADGPPAAGPAAARAAREAAPGGGRAMPGGRAAGGPAGSAGHGGSAGRGAGAVRTAGGGTVPARPGPVG